MNWGLGSAAGLSVVRRISSFRMGIASTRWNRYSAETGSSDEMAALPSLPIRKTLKRFPSAESCDRMPRERALSSVASARTIERSDIPFADDWSTPLLLGSLITGWDETSAELELWALIVMPFPPIKPRLGGRPGFER